MKLINCIILLLGFLHFTSCNNCQDEEVSNNVVGIEFLHSLKESKNGTKFSNLQFEIRTIDSIVAIRTVQDQEINSRVQYANVGFWSCESERFYLTPTNLDSIAITVDKKYNDNVGQNLTSILFGSQKKKSISESPIPFSDNKFNLIEPPSKLDTFQIEIRAFDKNGRIFIDTLSNIVIGQ